MTINVVLVDDHPIIRRGLALLLQGEPEMIVVGEAGDGLTAMEIIGELKPDIVVMDIAMPNMNGIQATQSIRDISPDTKILALSIHSGKRFVEGMLRAGASGYILKESIPEELVNGILTVARGEMYLSPAITEVVVSQLVRSSPDGESDTRLTPEQHEIVSLIREGHEPEQIATILDVSIDEVQSEEHRLLEKLGLADIAELSVYAQTEEAAVEPVSTSISETPDASVLRTKLHRPQNSPDVVPRERLLNRLSINRHRVMTLISAPAGYGKSVLVSNWLDSADSPNAWVSVDEKDNDIRHFLRHLLAAVQSIFPGSCRTSRALLNAPTLPSIADVAQYVTNDLDKLDRPYILVFDDYHTVQSMDVHDLITAVLRHPPENFHLILLTRRDPPLPLSTLRGQGKMHEITMDQLRFNQEETASFLKNAASMDLDETETKLIDQKIEGWAVGLRLVALSTQEKRDLPRLLDHLQGDFSHIMDYLVAEVVSRQSPAIVNHLLNTAILDRFCTPLCDALLDLDTNSETDDGRSFLAYLRSNNLFAVSLDTEHRWFRYHHMFQHLLHQQLTQKKQPEEIARLHCRASTWFADNDYVDEAIHHALLSNEPRTAAEIVKKHRKSVLIDDKWYILKAWLDKFPEEIVSQNPELLMTRAWILFHQFRLVQIPPVIEAVNRLLGDEPAEHPLTGELEFFQGYFLFLQNQDAQAVPHLETALERIPSDYQHIRGEAELHLGLALHMQGEKERVIRQFQHSLQSQYPFRGNYLSRVCAGLAFVHLLEGELVEALPPTQQLHELGTDIGSRYVIAWSAYLRAAIALLTNDLDVALHHFNRLCEDRYHLHMRTTIDGLTGLALTYQLSGQPEKADETMELLGEFARQTEEPLIMTVAQSSQARLSLLRGDVASSSLWARTADLTPDAGTMLFWLEVPRLTQCRVWIAEATPDSLSQATTMLEGYLKSNRAVHNTKHVIEILLLKSVLYVHQSEADKAISVLTEAVALGQHGSFITPFLELGSIMANLVCDLSEDVISASYRNAILAAFNGSGGDGQMQGAVIDAERDGVKDGSAARHSSLTASTEIQELSEPLTTREQEVLILLAEGMRNKEIASTLFLSSETIKKHLYNIYQKLDVHSRTSVIAKASKLGLLKRR